MEVDTASKNFESVPEHKGFNARDWDTPRLITDDCVVVDSSGVARGAPERFANVLGGSTPRAISS